MFGNLSIVYYFSMSSQIHSNLSYHHDLKEMHRTYVDHSLFDEILNAGNHCVEFIYETVIYIYCGKYYNDLLWLTEDLKSCGLGTFADTLPYVHYSL